MNSTLGPKGKETEKEEKEKDNLVGLRLIDSKGPDVLGYSQISHFGI